MMIFYKIAILGSDFDLKFDQTLAPGPSGEQSYMYEVQAPL